MVVVMEGKVVEVMEGDWGFRKVWRFKRFGEKNNWFYVNEYMLLVDFFFMEVINNELRRFF